MTRKEILLFLISQAYANGFEFRRWFQFNISPEWTGAEDAVSYLALENRYYALIFSHEFARCFWKKGARMNFLVPSATYSRMNGKGQVVTINRKPFTRRTIKGDVWKYHLREMATADDPVRYLRRFLPLQEDIDTTRNGLPTLSEAG